MFLKRSITALVIGNCYPLAFFQYIRPSSRSGLSFTVKVKRITGTEKGLRTTNVRHR